MYSLVDVYQCSERIYCLHFSIEKQTKEGIWQVSWEASQPVLHAGTERSYVGRSGGVWLVCSVDK
jgi:hypothetical protein